MAEVRWKTPHKQLMEGRRLFVRKLLARGLYDFEILNACEKSDLFVRTWDRDKRAKTRLSRYTIRREYLYHVKKTIREIQFDQQDEIAKAYEKLLHAHRLAVEQDNPMAIAGVHRELARMLGLRLPRSVQRLDVESVMREVEKMDLAVAPPAALETKAETTAACVRQGFHRPYA